MAGRQQTTAFTEQTGTNYVPSRDIRKGEVKMLYLRGKPIAFLKKQSVSFKTETEEISSKMSGDYDDKLGGKTSFSISCDAFVSNNEKHLSATALRHLAYSGKAHPFEICENKIKEDEQGQKTVLKGRTIMKGQVIITDVGEESEKGSYETMSLSLESSGAVLDASGNPYGSKEALAALQLGENFDKSGLEESTASEA